ncbi:MAG: TerB family tellurite resistance protein, partial [Hyphomicrobiaceae bacterium]|nr:TerB family tellurite resistance protein [Hyphomicrobiaceae bacterium]
VDGELAQTERSKLQDLLEKNYELSPVEAAELIKLGQKEDAKAVDLYGFTRRLARTLELDQRLEIIEMLWEIAYADGILHEFEQNLIWRVAELMHVETRERVRLRQKVQARLGIKS